MSASIQNILISATRLFVDRAKGDHVAECPKGADRDEVEVVISKLSSLTHLLDEQQLAELDGMIRDRRHQLTNKAIVVFVPGDAVLINNSRGSNVRGLVRRVDRINLTIEADDGMLYRMSPRLCRHMSETARSAG